MGRLLFAFTSHGFGHLTRTLEVLAEFQRLAPTVEVTVAADAPEWLVRQALPRAVELERRSYEPGAMQRNCFEVDVPATRAAYARWIEGYDARRADEEAFFDAARFDGVVVDIPALPVAVAAGRGLPVVGISNFTWDWLLAPLVDATVVDHLRQAYSGGDLFLRLPMGPDHSPFSAVEDTPLVGRRATRTPAEVRERLGWRESNRPMVLVCVGGWGAREWPAIHLKGCRDLGFVLVDDLPVTSDAFTVRLPNQLIEGVSFPDLVCAADVVLTKPGYGIASECLLGRTPMVGIERRDFREEAFLIEGLRREGAFVPLSLSEFFSGDWEASLRCALARDASSWIDHPFDGARQVAERLRHFFSKVVSTGLHSAGEVS